MSADAMIDSLLQKSDTFRKVNHDFPPWLQIDSPLRCVYYEQIWEVVRSSDKFVDTPRISQLLLTSGLHPNVLCYIWNLANKTTPGQLTKQELYIVLALVGLAQSGCTFNSLAVLNMVPSAPVPRLHLPFQSTFAQSPTVAASPTVPTVPAGSVVSQQSPLMQPLGLPAPLTQPLGLSAPLTQPLGLSLKSPLDSASPGILGDVLSQTAAPSLLTQTSSTHFVADDEFRDFQSVPSDPVPTLG